jgi:hypothetical protein
MKEKIDMYEMQDVWKEWYKSVDKLLEIDSMLGQVPGVSDQSFEFTRKLDAFRADAARILESANASARALEAGLKQ